MRTTARLVRTSVPALLESLHPIVLAGVSAEVQAWAELNERADRFAATREQVLADHETAKREALASTEAGNVVPLPPPPIVQAVDFSRLRWEASETFQAALLRGAEHSLAELQAVFEASVGGLRSGLLGLLRGKPVADRRAIDIADLSKVVDSWALLGEAVRGAPMGTGPQAWITDSEIVAAALGTINLSDIASAMEPPKLDPELVGTVDPSVEAVFEELYAEIAARASA